jgi:hypothetical protein
LILPIMLLLLAGAIDFGRMFYTFVAVENAAKEGALFGARHPMCGSASTTCPDPRNVRWVVENEAPNLKDGSGKSLLTTQTTCLTPAGSLVQPINDCVNGDRYVVSVSQPFRLLTPILSSLMPASFTLGSTSEATVIEDAYDPSGLEVLVWVDKSGADNATEIANNCVAAEPSSYYYAPCQDKQSTSSHYLQFQDGDTVKYKVRVRNTGNVSLTGLGYKFVVNGTMISKLCNLTGSLPLGAGPSSCTFTRTAKASNPVSGVADEVVQVAATGLAAGLPTGTADGSATIKVIPAPLLEVTLRAARYRLGREGNGIGGSAFYDSGNLTLDRTTDASKDITLRNPTGWLKVSVVNQGGPARNFTLSVTRDGSSVALPSSCAVPSNLAAAGSPGDSFICILPSTMTSTRSYDFVANASATNARYGNGDRTVTITTKTCSGGDLVIPNLVDRLSPPDGSRKSVSQARSLWTAAGFTGAFTTSPSNAGNSTPVLTQSVDAYTCRAPSQSVRVDTR